MSETDFRDIEILRGNLMMLEIGGPKMKGMIIMLMLFRRVKGILGLLVMMIGLLRGAGDGKGLRFILGIIMRILVSGIGIRFMGIGIGGLGLGIIFRIWIGLGLRGEGWGLAMGRLGLILMERGLLLGLEVIVIVMGKLGIEEILREKEIDSVLEELGIEDLIGKIDGLLGKLLREILILKLGDMVI